MATTPNSSSDGKKRYPLSITQEQFYSIYLSNPKSADYNIGVAIKFENPIEPSLLTKALNDIIVKHEILRSLFTTHDGKPLAIIEPSVIVEIPIISLKDQSPKDRRINIEKIIEGLRAESFDLGVAPLFRVALINLGDSLYVFAAIFHHIIMDGLSTILFIKELLTRYNDLNLDPNAKLEKPGYNYSHYVTKQRKLLQNDQSEILKFWKKQFHELPDPLQLPTDCPRSNMPPTIREYIFTLPQSILKGVEDLARLHGVSLFTCLLSAYQLFLNKYTHQNRIVVGVPFSARGSYESEDTLGPLIHTLPIVVDLRDNLSFTDILSINNKLILEAYKHQSLSLAKLLDELKIERSDRFPPLFQVLFNLLNLTRFSTVENKEEGVKAIPIWKESGRAAYDLSLEIDLDGDNPEIVLKYNSDLFKSDTVKSMAERFLYLLQEITASPSKPIGDYTLLTEGESGTLTKWNDTSAEYPLHKTLHELIEERAKLTPKSVALIFGGRKLTYKELNDKANILAKRLMGQGVTVETIVAISLERSLDTVISLLAVLKAGGAYLYLDHNNPTERLSFMLTDSGSGVLITKSEFKSKFPDYRGKFVLLDRSESLFKDTKLPVNVKTGVKPENLAYVIYTSGSTGTPKGTLIEHRGVVNCLFAIKSQVDITPKDIFLAVTALSFDVAALDYFLPLAIGARTVIAEQKNISNPRELIKLLNQYKPSAMQATPALWNMLTRAGWLGNKGFKVLTAGEALSKELAGELLERNYEIFNIYGPTEATIYTTISKITSSDNITIGKPLENIEVYIFDKDKRPVPIGITGELYIGGVGLARGYLNRPELTEKSFIAYRFQDGKEKRLYRTGDSVRYLPDGAIRYLGRIDQQIKLRGYRIELGEIESALLKIPNILQAVVVLYGSEISDKRLVAFLVLREPEDLENLDLAFELAKWLPGYMIPSNFVLIEELPLSPNGKINKDMLSSMVKTKLSVGAKTSNRSSDSNNLLEYILADIKKIISEIFPTEIPQIDEFRAFGEYGFNSITFGELSVKIGDKYSIEISPAIFYRYINSRLLANYLLATHPKRIEEIYSIAISNEPTKNESKRGDGANGSGGDIAIIGISCRVAGSPNAATFWRNLVEGRDSIGEIPPERWDWRRYVNYPGTRWGGFIEDIDKFDSDFFNIAPYEADFMDPQQRLLLESVWSAIEDAGYPASSFSGSDTAVFVGSTGSEYIMMQQLSGMEIESHAISGSAQSIAANRISYFFNLKGPSSPIDTACSSSLVATHRAIASINAGECGKAIVSGVNLLLTPNVYKGLSRMNMLSPEGRCKTFDESADGYVRGEGVISVILKPLNQALEDRDHIYAVVKGSAENHGGRTHGLTVPNPEAQSDLIVEAYGKAGIDPNTLTYIETHGTGTRLGDPIEIDGLREAFGELYKEYDKIPSDEAYCGIGSVKSNIGHLEGAAGIAGLLKVILSLRHKTIPATLHVEKPNPSIKLGSGPFYLALETKSWDLPKDRGKENFPRRAGVSSFGFGGSNAHVILEEAPKRSLDDIGAKPYYLIAISAKNPLSLRMRTHDLSDWLNLNGDADLESVAYTLNAGREHFSYRAALVVDSIQDLKLTLEQINADRNPANYFYSGNGEKYPPVSDKEIKKILDDLSRDRNLKTQDYRENLTLLASAYRNGYDLNWAALHSNGNKVRIPLPTYPFLRKRFWFSDKYFGEATQNNYSLSYYYPISLPSPPSPPVIKYIPFSLNIDLEPNVFRSNSSIGL